MRRVFISLGMLVVLAITQSAVAEATLKIGVVDFQKALNNVDEGKKAKKGLETEFKKKQKQLDIQQKELESMRDELKDQALVLSEDKVRAKQTELQDKFVEFRKKAVEYQQEMARREAELSGQILVKLKEIVSDIGQKEGYTMIVESSADPVLYVEGKEDLTDRVIKAYNKKY